MIIKCFIFTIENSRAIIDTVSLSQQRRLSISLLSILPALDMRSENIYRACTNADAGATA